MLLTLVAAAAAAAAATKKIKIGILMPATLLVETGTRDTYLQSTLTGHFSPGSSGYCSANLAARHVNAKDPTVVPTIANITANLTVELVHYDSRMSERTALANFYSMVRRDPATVLPCP